MSWTELKKSAKALFRSNEFEDAMEGYAAAAAAAINQNAAPRDIAKCYTKASQMAWRTMVRGLFTMGLPEENEDKIRLGAKLYRSRSKLQKMNISFAEDAIKTDKSWVKGSSYLLRGLAFDNRTFRDKARALQDAKGIAKKIISRHYKGLALSQIKDNALWLGLYLINHPLYTEFISQCPGFEAVKYPDEAAYISSTGSSCFDSFMEAFHFLTVLSHFESLEKGYSLLISPGIHYIETEVILTERLDFVGNRGHKSRDQLEDDGMKILEGGPASSDSVVLEFADNQKVCFTALSSKITVSRLSFVDRTKFDKWMFNSRSSQVRFDNCFFTSEFKTNVIKSKFLCASDSSLSLEDSVMTQAPVAVFLLDTRAILRNNTIVAYGEGVASFSSQLVIENVDFKCHMSIRCENDSKMKMSKCLLQEEPLHYDEHVPAFATPLVYAAKSTISVEDSMLSREFNGSYELMDILGSKFTLKNNQLFHKDTLFFLQTQNGSTSVIENNTFKFKKQQQKDPSLVAISKTDLLEFRGNVIQDLDELLKKGIKVFDICMPRDGIEPEPSDAQNILIVRHYVESSGEAKKWSDDSKWSEDFKHISVHLERVGLEGSKKSKAGKRLCHSCSKSEPEGEKSFRYCGQCKIISYCSRECQKEHWKKGHKNRCGIAI